MLIIAPAFLVYYLDTQATEAQHVVTDDLTKAVSTALFDTINISDLKFENRDTRIGFYNNLIDTLSASLGYNVTEDTKQMMEQKIPAIIFCANDGYYTVYTDINTATKQFIKVTSPKIPYSAVSGGRYEVQLCMDGTVKVNDFVNNLELEGDYSLIYEELEKPAALDFMENKADYKIELSYIIGNKIGRESEALLAAHIYGRESVNTYNVDVPTAEMGSVREITHPCVMCMYQGAIYSSQTSNVDIYAFSSVELQESVPFEIYSVDSAVSGKILYYHPSDSGHDVDAIERGTLHECAELGAVPCPECYH